MTSGRPRTGDHGTVENRMAMMERQTADLVRIAARLEKLASIDSDVRERDSARSTPQPQMSAALTRQNLRLRVSVVGLGISSIVLALGGVNVFSYAKGLSKGDDERVQTMAETKAVRAQLDEHETRIADVVDAQGKTAQRSALELRQLAELQLLQWQYMAEVLEAIRRKREIPKKPQLLVDAEARALVSLRDTP